LKHTRPEDTKLTNFDLQNANVDETSSSFLLTMTKDVQNEYALSAEKLTSFAIAKNGGQIPIPKNGNVPNAALSQPTLESASRFMKMAKYDGYMSASDARLVGY